MGASDHTTRLPIVVLVSGSGSLLAALIEASAEPAYGLEIVGVGADRPDIEGLRRAERAGIPTFVCRVQDYPTRAEWDDAMAQHLADVIPSVGTAEIPGVGHRWVISAGFMKVLGPSVLAAFTVLNTHPALLPAFPGAHAVREALAYGACVTGATVHLVDAGVDTGPIVAQRAVPIRTFDTEDSLHERIKTVERDLLVRTAHDIITDGFTQSGRKVTLA